MLMSMIMPLGVKAAGTGVNYISDLSLLKKKICGSKQIPAEACLSEERGGRKLLSKLTQAIEIIEPYCQQPTEASTQMLRTRVINNQKNP